ncbi:16S rRNA (adenine(1518)-N(6)/adenine(1519)-N(6))-dimethyltransferase RsmA [Geoalkalibacter halelectricus]|uniref:16S rRNA (adenine(1518)-N(6)/adenine(1519)-N(6))- dimethyltransferase RsmA n=1 Tax=Geoalkalibacter halelectricus TaxID=2847045 RepID=UPI00266FDD54|nr:16S rRNA (adenine(1518)-N(6)/adenine(1519)-N(6))-dimethyltransferase RsmA [Geoalkalibacter halelectricus]MDO3379645.1 16S rRNA (adenine(1518)-N(6)/adenine(1519)-N(6))-dimethyltransferase RsmA [Geoalkalibacter halelectricus]
MTGEHRPRKRFGQNFLRDSSVIDRILEAADLNPQTRVLEIGPGLGALTDRLLDLAGRVEVMEVDRDLVARLRERAHPRLEIHAGDALQLPWEQLLSAPPYTLVANLPYNISSQILFRILDHRHLFARLVLMFQKEVGERLCAVPGTSAYGILSVLCPLWFDIRRVVVVRPGAFYPPPKVDSVVLAFEALPGPRVPVADEAFFRRVVKAAFAQRRKTLRNTLKAAGFAEADLLAALARCGIDPQARGETLSLEQFARLAQALRD